MNGLTPKQKAFADNYIENGGNAEKAAVDAGYSRGYARGNAHKLVANSCISAYIAERQKQIDSQRIATLKEIQEMRTAIARGEKKDDLGFAPDAATQLKAMDSLEKALRIKEEQEEKQRAVDNKPYELPARVIGKSFVDINRQIKPNIEYVFEGGRGGLKSSFISLKIIELLKNHPIMHACITRQVAGTLKDSVYAQMKWAINELGLNEEFDCKVSPLEIRYIKTGQIIYFRGLDDETKLKSIKPPFGYIGILWKEEKDQMKGDAQERSVNQSVLRGGDESYDFSSYNPPKSKNNWVNKIKLQPNPRRIIHHSHYKDAPPEWLGEKFISDAAHLKEVNPEAYEHEYDGVPNGEGGNVFEYLELRAIEDSEIATFDRIYQGVDWGWYPDAYAFIRAYYDSTHEKIYLLDENYVHKTSNETTAEWIMQKGYDDYTITCDSNENKSVVDYRDRGLPARAAVKGPGSVEYGFKWLQRRTIVIDQRRTPNAYNEFTNYEYDRDKDGNVISGYPEGQDDHTIAATRYAFEQLFNKRGNSA